MDINLYTEEIVKTIKKKNKNLVVETHDVHRNNDLVLKGITIRTENRNVSPMIYTNEYYEHNLDVDEAASKIMVLYNTHKYDIGNSSVNAMLNFDTVKDKIIARVISKDRNKFIINSCPYAQFGDLIVTFAIFVEQNPGGTASIKITNEMMNSWKVNLAQLIEAAYKNTSKLFPLQVSAISEILKETMDDACELPPEMKAELEAELASQSSPMYVVTNTSKYFGAYFITDREALVKVASEIKDNRFFILPSSVHELVIVPESQIQDASDLTTMVKEVNATQVAPDEVLADNVYSFDAKTEELRTIDGTIIPFIA
jgi:hypothetical protein